MSATLDNADRFPFLKLEQHGAVLLVQLNRPRELNALATPMLEQIAQCLSEADSDPSISLSVITGDQRAFAAGADIDELQRKSGAQVATDPRNQHWATVRALRKPLIGAINGFCLGGGNELAMLCDFLVAGRNAQFGQPEVNLGILPGAGGTQRLAALAGKGFAMRWMLTGEFISAEQALQIGLVTEVCEPELTVERALNLAQLIAKKAPLAVAEIKQAVLAAVDQPLESGLADEKAAFARLLDSADKLEGIAAFREKRAANYAGK